MRLLAIAIVASLTGCASEVDYAPKDAVQLDQEAQEHRVFYEGWRHPEVSKEDREFFYHGTMHNN